MKNKIVFKLNNRIILFLILILASVLRFYKLNQIPFTFDEFSALFRTKYNTLNELIKFGVVGDGHPAGIQIFLFYLVKLFGFNEFWIKLPFAIFGVLSVLLTYHIAKSWFNKTVGLSSAIFIAALQFPIIYSQIARPYISGLFFSLLMVYFWEKYLFKSNKKIDKNLAGFIISAILCVYNHYFSLLFVLIAGISGLFFVKRSRMLYYIGSGIIIFLVFIPHLKITFSALKIGGLSWLGKPNAFFLIDYIKLIFHSSVFIGILVAALLTLSYFYRNKDSGINKFRILSLIFFILPLIVGFIYSISVKPVLQFSVLFFTFPFLIILLTSFLKEFSPQINLLIVSTIAVITSFSLIFEKNHYTIFYESGVPNILIENSKCINKYTSKENSVTTILSSGKNITKYYLENDTNYYSKGVKSALIQALEKSENYLFTFAWNKPDTICVFDEKTSIEDYKQFLSNQETDYLFYGWAYNFDWKILQIIPNYYPYLILKKDFNNSEIYLFSKKVPVKLPDTPVLYSNHNNFESDYKFWSKSKITTDTISYSKNYSCFISKETEYSTTFNTNFNSIFKNNSEIISTSIKFYNPDSKCNAFLVLSIENRNKTVMWYSVNLNDFINKNKKWQTANLIIQIDNIYYPFNKEVKVYIWNPNKEEFFIDDFSIEIYSGNKKRYKY